jgi:hypothetical protein
VITNTFDPIFEIGCGFLVGKLVGRNRSIDITSKFVEAIVAHRDAEVLGGDIFELVCLVDHRVMAGGNDFAVGALPYRRVSAEEMMIDDDQIRFGCALAHARDETVVIAGTFAADAVLTGRSNVFPEREILRQILQFGAIAGLGLRSPLVDQPNIDGFIARESQRLRGASLLEGFEPVKAQVISSTLHVGRRERNAKRLAQDGQVLVEDLLLKILGPGRDQDAATAEDGRNQIGKRLPGARPGFCQKYTTSREDVCRAVRERAGDRGVQRRGAGRGVYCSG